MSSWDDYRLFCIHGRREGLDSHDCVKCHEMSRKYGRTVGNIWVKEPSEEEVASFLREKAERERAND